MATDTTGRRGTLENPEVYENVPGHVIPILEREFDDFDNESERFLNGEQTEEQFIGFRLKQGVYGQRQADVQMIRVKLPFGGVNPEQMEAFAEVVEAGRPPRVVATSWVQFSRGWRTDLAALSGVAHDAGALLCIDVIQGLGVVPAQFEAWGVDFAMADAHKWMLGPMGIGLLYVRDTCLELLTPLEPGWASVAHAEDWDNLDLVWHPSARRLEGGSPNVIGIHGMGASIDLLLEAGVDAVWAHVSELCDQACQQLAEAGATVLSDRSQGGRSGVVTFSVEGRDGPEVVHHLRQQGVVCSPRGGGVRLSPHGYNTAEEIDRLVSAVSELPPGG